jgi:endonuclease-3
MLDDGRKKPTQARVAGILKTLRKAYPRVKTQLFYDTPFPLLVATILSAQCTDRQVNRVTGPLFARFKTPADFAGAPIGTIEEMIRSTGFFRNKARSIQNCARTLQADYGGQVPDDLDQLVQLPGVGRKTANVVLGAAFGVPGVVVDTHVSRISRRLGLTDQKDPVKIEFDLMAVIPKVEWSDFSLRLIYFGRETCTARKPRCPACPLTAVCSYPNKTVEIACKT